MNATTYYRIAERKYTKDKIMKGRGDRPLANNFPAVEAILESRRPSESLDRGDSVYMREDRDFNSVGVTFDEGYIHQIEPLGKVDKRDLTWIGVLQRRNHKDTWLRKNSYPLLSDVDVADNYWSGKASDNPSWEWITKEARVLEVDSGSSRVRPNPTPFLDSFSDIPPDQ